MFPLETEWRPIPGWAGIYEVSSDGEIRSLDRMRTRLSRRGNVSEIFYPGRVLVPGLERGGYLHVILADTPRREQVKIHRTVCAAFHGEPPPGYHAAHFDGDVCNNRACNLRWALPVENHADMERHGRRRHGERHPQAKLTEAAVREIRASAGQLDGLAVKFGVSSSVVDAVRYGRTWRHVV